MCRYVYVVECAFNFQFTHYSAEIGLVPLLLLSRFLFFFCFFQTFFLLLLIFRRLCERNFRVICFWPFRCALQCDHFFDFSYIHLLFICKCGCVIVCVIRVFHFSTSSLLFSFCFLVWFLFELMFLLYISFVIFSSFFCFSLVCVTLTCARACFCALF